MQIKYIGTTDLESFRESIYQELMRRAQHSYAMQVGATTVKNGQMWLNQARGLEQAARFVKEVIISPEEGPANG
jgi:hypothetical protein